MFVLPSSHPFQARRFRIERKHLRLRPLDHRHLGPPLKQKKMLRLLIDHNHSANSLRRLQQSQLRILNTRHHRRTLRRLTYQKPLKPNHERLCYQSK